MNSVTLRRVLVSPILSLVMAVLALFSGEFGRSDTAVSDPNAKIMLRRLRDLRQGEARLLAERLGSDRLELGLVGARVRVEENESGFVLYGRQNAVIGELVRLDSRGKSVFTCVAPGMGQLVYALDR